MRSIRLLPLALVAAIAPLSTALAADLAAPGMGMTQWQWDCQPDPPLSKKRSSPLDRDDPLAALASKARSLPERSIEPSVVLRSSPAPAVGETRFALKEGATWRGVPVSAFVERRLGSRSESYFVSPLSAQELSARLIDGAPFAGGPLGAEPPRRPLSAAETRALLAPLPPPSKASASASWVGCFAPRQAGSPAALRVRAAPG